MSTSSVPTHYPVKNNTDRKRPVWCSSALKSLYRDRTRNASKPTRNQVARIRSLFKGQSSVGEWRTKVEPEPHHRCSSAEGIEDRRDSVLGSTRATISPRHGERSDYSSATSMSEEYEASNDDMSGASSRACSSRNTPSQLPLSVTAVTTRDVAVSMGMSIIDHDEEVSTVIRRPGSGSGSGKSRKSRAPKKPSISQNCHLSEQSKASRKQSLKQSKSVPTAPIEQEAEPEPPKQAGPVVQSPSEDRQLPPVTSPTPPEASIDRVSPDMASRHHTSHSQASAPDASSFLGASSQHQDRPHRVSLTALRHMPKSEASDNGSSRVSRRSRRKSRKKKKKVEYYFDSERGVIIRSGLYDEKHRPVEKGKRPDLFKRVWRASIWRRLAHAVLW